METVEAVDAGGDLGGVDIPGVDGPVVGAADLWIPERIVELVGAWDWGGDGGIDPDVDPEVWARDGVCGVGDVVGAGDPGEATAGSGAWGWGGAGLELVVGDVLCDER